MSRAAVCVRGFGRNMNTVTNEILKLMKEQGEQMNTNELEEVAVEPEVVKPEKRQGRTPERHSYRPTKYNSREIKDRIVELFDPQTYDLVMGYFAGNPRKTCCHIKHLRLKVRKFGSEYTIEEA